MKAVGCQNLIKCQKLSIQQQHRRTGLRHTHNHDLSRLRIAHVQVSARLKWYPTNRLCLDLLEEHIQPISGLD